MGEFMTSKNFQIVDTDNGQKHFSCYCYQCNKHLHTNKEIVYADLNGDPFRAYYCASCAEKEAKKEGDI